MNTDLCCWKCGAPLAGLMLPLGRRDQCPGCHAELHVCSMCRHYDPRRAKQCRELAADEVRDKTRANFCGWFVPRADAYQGGGAAIKHGGRAALDALFGESGPKDGVPQTPDDLFSS
jgi:hypothetical protein